MASFICRFLVPFLPKQNKDRQNHVQHPGWLQSPCDQWMGKAICKKDDNISSMKFTNFDSLVLSENSFGYSALKEKLFGWFRFQFICSCVLVQGICTWLFQSPPEYKILPENCQMCVVGRGGGGESVMSQWKKLDFGSAINLKRPTFLLLPINESFQNSDQHKIWDDQLNLHHSRSKTDRYCQGVDQSVKTNSKSVHFSLISKMAFKDIYSLLINDR